MSRTHRLDQSFLLAHLKGARSYQRIAGYDRIADVPPGSVIAELV